MGLFYKVKKEKETNIAETPQNMKPKKEFSKAKFYYLLWTIVSMTFHCTYVFYLIMTIAQQYFLSKAILLLLFVYAVILILIIVFSIGNRKKLKARLKTYKSALNFLKYLIQLISFSLAIVNSLSTFFVTGKFDKDSLFNAFVSMVITIIMVLFEVVKILIRKNIPIVKNNFLKIKEQEDIERQERLERKQKLLEEKRNLKNIKKHKGLVNFDTTKIESNNSDNLETSNNLKDSSQFVIATTKNLESNTIVDSDLGKEGFKQESNGYTMKTKLKDFLSKNAHRNRVDNYEDLPFNKKQDNTNSVVNKNNNVDDDFPVLGKNEEYDENAGVIIDYDDGYDEDDDEDYYDEEIVQDDNKKKSGKFSRFFKGSRK